MEDGHVYVAEAVRQAGVLRCAGENILQMTVHYPYVQMVCAKCSKPLQTILEPCPHCGYQRPLTKAGKEQQRKHLTELLAKVEHKQWKHWIDFQLRECAIDPETATEEEERQAQEKWEAWVDLADTPYSQLTEEQKESDREWARKVLEVLRPYLQWNKG